MNIFCPFFRDKCKANECVMWKDERCLIISFIEHLMTPPQTMRETQVPDEIASASPEELAAQLLSFAKDQSSDYLDDEGIYAEIRLWSLFWESKNVSGEDIPTEIKLKRQKAETLAARELQRESEVREKQREVRKNEQLQRERTELPSLVSSCVDWAKAHGRKAVTKADVEVFLMDKDIAIMPETQKSLYARANVQLRSRY